MKKATKKSNIASKTTKIEKTNAAADEPVHRERVRRFGGGAAARDHGHPEQGNGSRRHPESPLPGETRGFKTERTRREIGHGTQ